MIDVTDIGTEITTLGAYVLVLAGLVVTSLGFRYGFKAAWTGIRSVFANMARSTKG